MKAALVEAATAEPKELTRRMKAMRKTVIEKDVLEDLTTIRPVHRRRVRRAVPAEGRGGTT
jgi:trehalose 6-phosphate synthase